MPDPVWPQWVEASRANSDPEVAKNFRSQNEKSDPEALERAGMSKYAYGGKDADPSLLKKGWRVSTLKTTLKYVDPNTGFKSELFERLINGRVVEYCYAFADTDPSFLDVKADVQQYVGRLTEQYEQAVGNAKAINEIANSQGIKLSFTGHSLGGGLASLAAEVTDRSAITFNAAGLSWGTEIRYGILFHSESNIQAYIVQGEPLDYFQGSHAEGKRHTLYNDDMRDNITLPYLRNHSIDRVLEILIKNR